MPLRGDELERETTRKATKAANDPRNTGQKYEGISKRDLKKMMRGEAPTEETPARQDEEGS